MSGPRFAMLLTAVAIVLLIGGVILLERLASPLEQPHTLKAMLCK